MSKELAVGFDLISELNTELSVIDSKKLAKISEKMKEMDRANNSFGKGNTQTTSQLMTLTMLCDAPYRRLRQVLAQIEKKRATLEETAFKLRKSNYRLKKYREKTDELSLIKADEIQHNMHRSKLYVEGALKELAMYQDTYDEIKRSHNIPDNWDEMDMEKEEISNHVRMAFRNCLRNMLVTGGMNMGTLEYLEQFGIHPITAKKLITDYLVEVEAMVEEGKYPSVTHLYDFLDRCAEIFQDAHHAVMSRIGIKSLLKDEYMFTEMRDVA
tara:strand:+ start:1657 stop:2466 length:810 start_codon:yes stop_codon:yes gene_type:complete